MLTAQRIGYLLRGRRYGRAGNGKQRDSVSCGSSFTSPMAVTAHATTTASSQTRCGIVAPIATHSYAIPFTTNRIDAILVLTYP
jgi:hypothetical protein